MAVTNHFETVSPVAVVFSRAAAAVQDLFTSYRNRKIEKA